MHTKNIQAPVDENLTLKCHDLIQEDILNGKLAPGKKLKVEELKQQLNVGQTPVREALSRLTSTGLVEALDNRGFRVAEVSEENVRDLYQVYFDIETLALKQAITFGDDAWEGNVVSALHQLALVENAQTPIAYNTWMTRNYNFHVTLISGCNSPLLLQIRADVYKKFDRYCRIAFNLENTDLVLNHDEHKKMAEAVLKRDTTQAIELMRYHIFGALEDVIKTLKKNKLI